MEAEDYDLSGMDPGSAREYVLAVIVTYKQTKKRIESLCQEKGLWENRMHLAEQKGVSDLRQEAEKKVQELSAEILKLEEEAREYKKQADILKGQLNLLKKEAQLTINADLLLSELTLLVGEEDKTAQSFKEFEAEAALEALKNKLKEKTDE